MGRGRRERPDLELVDRDVDVLLPEACPHCGCDDVVEDGSYEQFQEDIPPVGTVITRFLIHLGWCRGCGRRIRPRHRDQTSDAAGAAGVMLGPRAVAWAAWLHKELGLSLGKVRKVLARVGLAVSRGGLSQAIARAGRRAEPTYDAMAASVAQAPQVTPDETGWRIGGLSAWAWVFVTSLVTVVFDPAWTRLRPSVRGAARRLRRAARPRRLRCVPQLQQGPTSDM